MNLPPLTTEPDLTFRWPAEKGFPMLLFVCVSGSIIAHAATFFLFQVVYQQQVTIQHSAPHVSLLTPSSPENIALLRWVEAEDPALVASDEIVMPPRLVDIRYIASFAAPRTAPLGAPGEGSPEQLFPPAVDGLSLTPAESHRSQTPPPAAVSVMRLEGGLAPRPLIKQLVLRGFAHSAAPVIPTVFLIGVTAEGEIRFVAIQQISGDSGLDDFARTQLRSAQFGPGASPVTWGFVTFAWGADVYANVEKSAVNAAP